MTDILAIPAEFDTISVGHIHPGTYQAYGEKRLLPRPPLGPFAHHAVRTFAKTCSEGRIGLNWQDHLRRARETWKSLSPEELSTLGEAAERDKQRYHECMELAGQGGPQELLHLLHERKLQVKGVAPSAFDLFNNSPEVRSRLFEAKEGVPYYNFFDEKAFIWLWGRIDDEEKGHWRQEAKRQLDITNNARRVKGEEDIILDTEPQSPEEAPSPGKRMRLGAKSRPPEEVVVIAEPDDNDHDDEDDADADDDNQESQITEADVLPVDDVLQWKPIEDEDLTTDERRLLESIPPDLHRWDRCPRAARNAYTLYYADRLTTAGSPHIGEDPHWSITRAKIHADWEAADDETHQHFENLAKADEEEFDRQRKEYGEWQSAWWDQKKVFLLRKVIDRWHPRSSFGDGENRLPARIPRRPPVTEPPSASPHPRTHPVMEPTSAPPHAAPAVDYLLPSLHYPVIRTDYSNGAVHEHLRHVLMNSEFFGEPTSMEMTFYDGLPLLSPSASVWETAAMPSFAEDDLRAMDMNWCKTNLENRSLDDLKFSLGELAFHWKERVPIYSFGGHSYAIVIDSQSMRDGTVMFVSLSSYDVVESRPEGDDGAWLQDEQKAWYLAPRVQAADVVIQLVNLDIANVGWTEYVQHRVDHGLDLFSDPKAQQWRGWQWAIEFVFGEQALENVVGAIETIPAEAFLLGEDE